MREDLFEQNPRTSGLTPVSGATDFSMDEGRLMRMGDIRIIVRDHHTRRIVFPFRAHGRAGLAKVMKASKLSRRRAS